SSSACAAIRPRSKKASSTSSASPDVRLPYSGCPHSLAEQESPMLTHQFTRRTLLRGLGVSMALPWLESLNVWGDVARGSRAASEAPVRLAVLFAGNGFHSKEWWAKGQGDSMELGKVLTPLAELRKKMLVIRGLYNAEAQKGNIHSSQTGNLLS